MHFKEKIGDYTIINHGEILVYNNEIVQIELIEENSIFLKIKFDQIEGDKKSIKHKLEDNTLTFQFINLNNDDSYYGIFEPIQIGQLNNKNPLYFNVVIYTLNAKYGNRILKYAFLTKE